MTRKTGKSSTADAPFHPPDWPASQVQMWAIDKIKPYPKNARTHPQEEIDALAHDMREDGVTTAILVDEEGVIIYGHARRLAAIANGFTEYPVMIARGWSETKKRAVRIKDNQRGLMAEWNLELLRIELTDLKIGGYELPTLGFAQDELLGYLADPPSGQDPEDTPEPPAKPVVRSGDLWQLGEHRLLCGDSTKAEDVARVLAGRSPNLMVTDPPYGVNYDPDWRDRVYRSNGTKVGVGARGKVSNDHRDDWREAWALFPGNVVYVWHGALHSGVVERSIIESGFLIRAQIIWDKGRVVIGRGDYHWQHEPCWYAVRKGKPGGWTGGRKQTTVWQISKPMANDTGHSTQKPVDCMRRPIENNSRRGDAVYEPFSGSGTTIIAAEMTGRLCLAVELEPSYVEVTLHRWEKFTGKKALLNGKTFDQVKAERAKERLDATRDRRKSVRRPRQPADGGVAPVEKPKVRAPVRPRRDPAGRVADRQPPATDAAGDSPRQ